MAALLYILTFCVPVTLNLRPVDYRHFSQHSSSTDSCLSLLNYLHGGFLIRSRFLPFTAQLFAHGFLTPFQISAYHCPTIYKWVSWSVPDFCLSLPNYLHIGFLFRSRFLHFTAQLFTHGFLIPFQISAFHCSTIYPWVSYSVPDFCLSLLNYLVFTNGFLIPLQISAFHCSTIYTWVSYSGPDFCLWLPPTIHIHVGFLFLSRFLPFTAQQYTHTFLIPFQISAFHCSTTVFTDGFLIPF